MLKLFTKLIVYTLSIGIVFVLSTASCCFSASTSIVPQKAKALVTWVPNNDPAPEGYRVYQRREGESYDFRKPSWTGAGTSAIIYNLNWDTAYYYVVTAYKAGEVSPPSDEVFFLAPLSAQKTHNISVSYGDPGSINNEITITVVEGYDLRLNITPMDERVEPEVLMDGVPVGPVKTYTFENVTMDHNVSANFASIEAVADRDNDGVDDNTDPCPDDPEDFCIENRVESGKIAPYPSDEGAAAVVHDQYGYGEPSDLTKPDQSAIETIDSPTIIRSESSPPDKFNDEDEDGTIDERDAFPDDPTEWSDTDNDGVGDNADPCPDDPEDICFKNRE